MISPDTMKGCNRHHRIISQPSLRISTINKSNRLSNPRSSLKDEKRLRPTSARPDCLQHFKKQILVEVAHQLTTRTHTVKKSTTEVSQQTTVKMIQLSRATSAASITRILMKTLLAFKTGISFPH